MTMTKYERARNLRYKRAALDSIGWEDLTSELLDIEEACSDVRWYFDEDGDNLVAAMDGDEDEAYEFKMAFADLEASCEQLREIIGEEYGVEEYYNDCTVALIGNRYNVVGFDAVETDYFALCRYEADLAVTEAGKRVTRWTKTEMLAKIGQCMGIVMAFLDLRRSYDYLKATMDILRDQNASVLQTIKDIERAYDKMDADDDARDFDRLCKSLPDRIWLE